MQTVEKCKKQRTKPEGQVICLSKGALFLCFTAMQHPEQTGGFPTGRFVFYDAASCFYNYNNILSSNDPHAQDIVHCKYAVRDI